MSDLQSRFTQAQADVTSLAERPNNTMLLKLYALYKQATDGDVHGEEPGKFDLVAKKKYAAWAQVRGMSTNDAMQAYIDTVQHLLAE